MSSRSFASAVRLLAAVALVACFQPHLARADRMSDEDIIRPRKKSSSGGRDWGRSHHFQSRDPEATLGIGAYATWVAPYESRAVPAKGGGMDMTALLMTPFERDSDFAMIVAFRNMYGGLSPGAFHFDLRMSLGAAIGLGPFAAGPFVGIGMDGMPRLDATGEGSDFPRIPSALQAHYGAVIRFSEPEKFIVEATGEIDKRYCSEPGDGGYGPFEVCRITRLEGRVQVMPSRDVGFFAALRWEDVGHSTVWGVSLGVAPNTR